jgi:propionyl-CoA synthetase
VADELKGEMPRGFVVLKAGADADPAALTNELAAMIRDRIGPIAALRSLDIVPGLPKTRSGKILRKTMRGIANGRDEPVPSTIDDPAVIESLKPILRR